MKEGGDPFRTRRLNGRSDDRRLAFRSLQRGLNEMEDVAEWSASDALKEQVAIHTFASSVVGRLRHCFTSQCDPAGQRARTNNCDIV